MNLCTYLFKQGVTTIEHYENIESQIEQKVSTILSYIKSIRKPNNGMYYPIDEIISQPILIDDIDVTQAIIYQLKQKGLECIENNTLYRY